MKIAASKMRSRNFTEVWSKQFSAVNLYYCCLEGPGDTVRRDKSIIFKMVKWQKKKIPI